MRWRVLCYHVVEPALRREFGRQLDAFRRRGWEFCSLSEGVQALRSRDGGRHERYITVSFDDGDHTICEVAQPELDARGIKAVLYLTTDFVVQGRVYHTRSPRPAAHWDQLCRWLEAGHEIGSHTHTHRNLAQCSAEKIGDEIDRSSALIREMLGVDPVHFSYPWGQYGGAARCYFSDTEDWRSAATIDRGWNRVETSPYALKRDVIEPDWPNAKVYLLMRLGDIEWLYAGQRRLRGLSYSR